MIINGSRLVIADNSGAKEAECIHILGGTKKKYASLGDVIVVAIKKAASSKGGGAAKKGDVSHAVIVRTKKKVRRPDGTYIGFDQNAAVLVNKEGEPKGTRIFGPVAREETREVSPKIASLASQSL